MLRHCRARERSRAIEQAQQSNPPSPLPERARKARRDEEVIDLEPVNELIGIQQSETEIDERCRIDGIQTAAPFGRQSERLSFGLPFAESDLAAGSGT